MCELLLQQIAIQQYGWDIRGNSILGGLDMGEEMVLKVQEHTMVILVSMQNRYLIEDSISI